jgi:hypothetical protein
MSTSTIEKLITNSIHTAFIKYPEADGGPHLDYEWIPPEHSANIRRAILMDLEANGFKIVKAQSFARHAQGGCVGSLKVDH